jgi:hypothetical protein
MYLTMAKYTEEQLQSAIKGAISILTQEEEAAAKAAEEDAQKKAEADREAEIEARIRAQLQAEVAGGEKKTEQPEKVGEPEKAELSAAERKLIFATAKAELANKGISTDLVDSIEEFIAYDRLTGDNGEADDEKLKTFVDTLSGIALRKPPRGGSSERDILNPSKGGLGKYLPQDNK